MTLNVNFSRSLLALACIQALCSTAHADKDSLKPYVGGGVGYSVVDVKNNHYELANGSGATTSTTSNAAAKGAVEYLFFGLQKQIQNMALGGELYGYLSQQKGKFSTAAGFPGATTSVSSQTVQRKYGYGVKLKAGYFVNSTALAYVHVGLENARFQYAGTTNLSKVYTFKSSKTLMGVPLGAGFELDISSMWKTRLEYTYTQYKRWNTGNMITTDTVASKLTPSQHAVVLGFSYQI